MVRVASRGADLCRRCLTTAPPPCPRATVPIPTTGVKLDGKAPTITDAAFVAPSANLVGAVSVGSGASV
eukprot:7390955-Prymnesium_polylepis.1